eukprot:GHVS01000165.1.p1 GENE.GHVS01000165.1~~GHVS01000165.1.p1  ORF type:complete len:187 (+),score=31.42 GHVS01000165.1:26-586(+)
MHRMFVSDCVPAAIIGDRGTLSVAQSTGSVQEEEGNRYVFAGQRGERLSERMTKIVAGMWDEVGEQMGVSVDVCPRALELSKCLLLSFAEAVGREAHMLAAHRRDEQMLPADVAQALCRSWSHNSSSAFACSSASSIYGGGQVGGRGGGGQVGGRCGGSLAGRLHQSGSFKRRAVEMAKGRAKKKM